MSGENLSLGFFCLEEIFDLEEAEKVIAEFTNELEDLAGE